MKRRTAAVFLVQRIGPYHHARLNAWAALRKDPVKVIEFRTGDTVYAWSTVKEEGSYERFETCSTMALCRKLDELQPAVVVCVGYADPEINQAVMWALRHRVPLVTCSDSTYADEPRSWIKEVFKRRVVAAFDAALVAGGRAKNYLESLGLDRTRQFRPWDVVDNAYFAEGAGLSRKSEAVCRARLRLPVRYFLCVARFVPKKNLLRLIEAYTRYVERAGKEAWSLVLSGAGPQGAQLRESVTAAGLTERVHFIGFLQYSDLPACYGLAGALILPSVSDQWGLVVNEAMATGLPVLVSSRCGCVADLVEEERNGFTFPPEEVEALAQSLKKMAEMDQSRRKAMGERSREIIAAFSPLAFAEGMEAAVACALARRRSRSSWFTLLVTRALALRSASLP